MCQKSIENIKNKNHRKITIGDIILIVIFCISSFASAIFSSSLCSMFAISIALYILVIKPNIFLACFIGITAFPFFFIIHLGSFSDAFNRLLTIMLLLYSLIVFLKTKKSKTNNSIHVCTYLLIIFNISSLFYNYTNAIVMLNTWILNLILFYLLSKTIKEEYDLSKVFNALSIFTITIIPLIFYRIITNPFIANTYNQRVSLSEDLNNNRLGMAIALYGCILIINVSIRKGIWKKLIILIMVFISVYMIILTGSRTSFIACSLVCILVSIKKNTKKNSILKNVFFLLIIISSILIIFNFLSSSKVISRFSISSVIETRGSFRLDSWKPLLFQIFPKHFLLGIGVGASQSSLIEYGYFGYQPAHNIIISSFVELGILGFIPFITIVLISIENINTFSKQISWGFSYKYMLYLVLLLGIGENIYTERILWVIMAICIQINEQYTIPNGKDVVIK